MSFLDRAIGFVQDGANVIGDRVSSLLASRGRRNEPKKQEWIHDGSSVPYDVGGLAYTHRETIGPEGQIFFYIPSEERKQMRESGQKYSVDINAQVGYSFAYDIARAKLKGQYYMDILKEMYLYDLTSDSGFPVSAYMEAPYSQLEGQYVKIGFFRTDDAQRIKDELDRARERVGQENPMYLQDMDARAEFANRAYALKEAAARHDAIPLEAGDRKAVNSFLADLTQAVHTERNFAWTMSYFSDMHGDNWLGNDQVHRSAKTSCMALGDAMSYLGMRAVAQHGRDFLDEERVEYLMADCDMGRQVHHAVTDTELATYPRVSPRGKRDLIALVDEYSPVSFAEYDHAMLQKPDEKDPLVQEAEAAPVDHDAELAAAKQRFLEDLQAMERIGADTAKPARRRNMQRTEKEGYAGSRAPQQDAEYDTKGTAKQERAPYKKRKGSGSKIRQFPSGKSFDRDDAGETRPSKKRPAKQEQAETDAVTSKADGNQAAEQAPVTSAVRPKKKAVQEMKTDAQPVTAAVRSKKVTQGEPNTQEVSGDAKPVTAAVRPAKKADQAAVEKPYSEAGDPVISSVRPEKKERDLPDYTGEDAEQVPSGQDGYFGWDDFDDPDL